MAFWLLSTTEFVLQQGVTHAVRWKGIVVVLYKDNMYLSTNVYHRQFAPEASMH